MKSVPKASEIILEILRELNRFKTEAGPSKDCYLVFGDVARNIYEKHNLQDGGPKRLVYHCFKKLHEDDLVRIPSIDKPNERGEISIDKFLINITNKGVTHLDNEEQKLANNNDWINIENVSGVVNLNSNSNTISQTNNSKMETSGSENNGPLLSLIILIIGGLVSGLIVAYMVYNFGWNNQ